MPRRGVRSGVRGGFRIIERRARVDALGFCGSEDYIVRYDAPGKPTLEDFAFEPDEKFLHEYDFISWWQHEVRVEKILPLDAKKTYPVCIDGKRAFS